MRKVTLVLVVLFVALACFAQNVPEKKQKAKKPSFPALITAGTFVIVETCSRCDPYLLGSPDGRTEGENSVMSPRTTSDDRQAVLDMEDAIRRWGKYKIATHGRDADLIFMVRKGRRPGVERFDSVTFGTDVPVTVGDELRVQVHETEDTLAIYDASRGTDHPPLWVKRLRHGLDAPDVKLLQMLREEMEKAQKP